MHHLLLIRPVKLEWLIGVAYLPVSVCALCRGKAQSLSLPPPPPPSPPHPGGVGKHDNLRWIKNWSLCHKSWFVHYQEVPLLWWNDRVSEEEKEEENPLAEASRTLNPAGCQSCLWEEPWVWLLILSLSLSLASFPASSACRACSFPPLWYLHLLCQTNGLAGMWTLDESGLFSLPLTLNDLFKTKHSPHYMERLLLI